MKGNLHNCKKNTCFSLYVFPYIFLLKITILHIVGFFYIVDFYICDQFFSTYVGGVRFVGFCPFAGLTHVLLCMRSWEIPSPGQCVNQTGRPTQDMSFPAHPKMAQIPCSSSQGISWLGLSTAIYKLVIFHKAQMYMFHGKAEYSYQGYSYQGYSYQP